MKINLKQILVVVATFGVIAINYFAAQGYINNVTPAVISDKYPTFITPAGYAFAIWSLIYLGLIAFSIYQALPSQTENPRFKNVRTVYVANCAANCLWIYLWHYDQILASLGVMLIILGTLVLINVESAKCRNICGNVACAHSVQPLFRLDYGRDDFEFYGCAGFSRRKYERSDFGNFKFNFNRRRGHFRNFNSLQTEYFRLSAGNCVGFNSNRRQTKRQNFNRRLRRVRRDRAFSYCINGVFEFG